MPAELLEAQVAAYVGGMVLPDEYLTAVKRELQRRLAVPDSGEAERLRRELERWKRLFVQAGKAIGHFPIPGRVT